VNTLWYRRLAPVIDAVILVVFVTIGRDQHNLESTGLTWYLTVLWPLAVGWAAGALAMRLYTRADRSWLRLLGTLAIGVFVDAVLRAAFTNRPWFSVFSIVAFCFLGLVTFGWRLVWAFGARLRGTAPAQ
jgi:predicted Na+-dependent transporter